MHGAVARDRADCKLDKQTEDRIHSNSKASDLNRDARKSNVYTLDSGITPLPTQPRAICAHKQCNPAYYLSLVLKSQQGVRLADIAGRRAAGRSLVKGWSHRSSSRGPPAVLRLSSPKDTCDVPQHVSPTIPKITAVLHDKNDRGHGKKHMRHKRSSFIPLQN